MRGVSQLSRRVFTKAALLQVAALLLVFAVLGISLREKFRIQFLAQVSRTLDSVRESLSLQLPANNDQILSDWCQSRGKKTQTWVSLISSRDGQMYCDTVYQPGKYPGVIHRPEIQSALASPNQRGFSQRLSADGNRTPGMYSTLYFPDRDLVLRVGQPIESLEQELSGMDRQFAIAMLVITLFVLVILQLSIRGLLFRKVSQTVLEHERKMESEFVANVSHEFRTPLTSILGFTQNSISRLNAGEKPPTEHLQIIHQEADRLLTLVNELLDLSALDAGSLALHPEEVAVEEITEDALKRLQVIYKDKQHRIEAHYDTNLSWVWADPHRLLQILLNLIGNSMKYCPPATSIVVRWKMSTPLSSSESAKSIELWVSDEGPGLSDQQRENLFQRFYRDPSNKVQSGSSGLGLAIVRSIMEAHGGRIEDRSTGKKGMHWLCVFPRNQK